MQAEALREPEKTVDILEHYLRFLREMTSEKWAQKFHTDNVSQPKSG